MSKAEEAAAAAAATLVAGDDEEEETPSSEAEQETEEEDFPSFEVELPEELREELELPDFEEENDNPVDEEDDDLYEDDVDLRKKLAAAEKKARWYEEQQAQAKRGKWEEEAKKFFPLSESFLGEIDATSRRSFLKEAKARHEAVKPYVHQYLTKAKESVAAERERIRQEEKEAAAKAWGRPAGSSMAPSGAEEHEAQVEKARRHGELSDVIKAMIFPKKG